MAEWSKALDSSSSLSGGVGSNPTSTMFCLFVFVRSQNLYAPSHICPQNAASMSRLAQLVERKTLNLVVVGSSPTVGAFFARRCTFVRQTSRYRTGNWSRSSHVREWEKNKKKTKQKKKQKHSMSGNRTRGVCVTGRNVTNYTNTD